MLNVIYPLKTSFIDYPDDESEAVLVYLMGCDNNCKNCQNLKFKNKNYSNDTKLFTPEQLFKEIENYCKRINTDKVVLTGGDPLSFENIKDTKSLTILLKNYKFTIYTGHDLEYIQQNKIENFTFIKCENYIPELNQISEKTNYFLRFASSNQKLYDSNFNLLSSNGTYYFNR